MPASIPNHEKRSRDQLEQQYRVERELGDRLRAANKSERRSLYTQVYDELFERVKHHPQLTRKVDDEGRRRRAEAQFRTLEPFLEPSSVFMEIGAGDCALSFEVARHVERVFAVDVSREITKSGEAPPNFDLIITDGCTIPVPPGSVDVAYSYQLMEHLHPDDATEQLTNVCAALRPGGVYMCVTPNRINGPWDISRYFADVANGVHLKEYTNGELATMFHAAGFSRVRSFVRAKGLNLMLPVGLMRGLEGALQVLPNPMRRRLTSLYPFKLLLGVYLLGWK